MQSSNNNFNEIQLDPNEPYTLNDGSVYEGGFNQHSFHHQPYTTYYGQPHLSGESSTDTQPYDSISYNQPFHDDTDNGDRDNFDLNYENVDLSQSFTNNNNNNWPTDSSLTANTVEHVHISQHDPTSSAAWFDNSRHIQFPENEVTENLTLWSPGYEDPNANGQWSDINLAWSEVQVAENSLEDTNGGSIISHEADLPLEVSHESAIRDNAPEFIDNSLSSAGNSGLPNEISYVDSVQSRSPHHLDVPGNNSSYLNRPDNSRVRFIIGSEPESVNHSQANTPEPSERIAENSSSYVDGPMNAEPDGAETESSGSPHTTHYVTDINVSNPYQLSRGSEHSNRGEIRLQQQVSSSLGPEEGRTIMRELNITSHPNTRGGQDEQNSQHVLTSGVINDRTRAADVFEAQRQYQNKSSEGGLQNDRLNDYDSQVSRQNVHSLKPSDELNDYRKNSQAASLHGSNINAAKISQQPNTNASLVVSKPGTVRQESYGGPTGQDQLNEPINSRTSTSGNVNSVLNPSLYSDSHVRQFQTEEIRGRQIHQLDYQSRFNDEYQSRYNDEHSKGVNANTNKKPVVSSGYINKPNVARQESQGRPASRQDDYPSSRMDSGNSLSSFSSGQEFNADDQYYRNSYVEESRGKEMYEQGYQDQAQYGSRPVEDRRKGQSSNTSRNAHAFSASSQANNKPNVAYQENQGRPTSRQDYSYDRPNSRAGLYTGPPSINQDMYSSSQHYRQEDNRKPGYQSDTSGYASYSSKSDDRRSGWAPNSSRAQYPAQNGSHFSSKHSVSRQENYGRPSSRQDYSYDRPSSRASTGGSHNAPVSGLDYNYHNQTYRPSSQSEDSRGRQMSRSDYQDSTRSRSRSTDDRRKGYDAQDQYSYNYYPQNMYSGYYDPRYMQGDPFGMGYAAEIQSYNQEYAKQMAEYYRAYNMPEYSRAWEEYYRASSRGSTPAFDSELAADHFAQDRGSRPSSRPASRQGNHDSERYPLVGSEMDDFGYHTQPAPSGRRTPQKYLRPHMRASFGPSGQLIKIMPSRPAEGEPAIVIMEEMPANIIVNKEEVSCFPGPLIKGVTHKNDVLLFCQRRLQEIKMGTVDSVDREGMELMWKYLELLIKQNGVTLGTDIADLLLEKVSPMNFNMTAQGVDDVSKLDFSLDKSRAEYSGMNPSRLDSSVLQHGDSLPYHEVLERFRHLLLHGRKKDALEWAMKQNQWGYAFFLASKMDAKTHASVLTRFANSSMRMNDPLQTFYQLMSGRQPAAVTLAADEKWGDWRPHLAMILSNSSPKPELDRKSVTALGDTLSSKMYTFSSHLCYLLAGTNFGSHLKKTEKLVLIGAPHGLTADELLDPSFIQCTEVYEYARALANPDFIIPSFQLYKFLYAIKLLNAGFVEEAAQYCEVVAGVVTQYPQAYPVGLLKALLAIGGRLQSSRNDDDSLQQPAWISLLENTVYSLEGLAQQNYQPYQEGDTYMAQQQQMYQFNEGQNVLSLYGETNASFYQQQQFGETNAVYQQQQQQQLLTDQFYAQQPQEYPVSYQAEEVSGTVTHAQQASQLVNWVQYRPTQNVTTAETSEHQTYEKAPSVTNENSAPKESNVQANEIAIKSYEDNAALNSASTINKPAVPMNMSVLPINKPAPPPPPSANNNVPASPISKTASPVSGAQGISENNFLGTNNDVSDGSSEPSAGFDYYNAAANQAKVAEAKLSPPSSPQKTAGEDVNSVFQFGVAPPPSSQYTVAEPNVGLGTRGKQKWPGEDDDEPSVNKSSNDKKKSSVNSKSVKGEPTQPGFIGRVWTKITGGPRGHEMRLPDDKNPSIVWDAAKGRYVNSDGSEIGGNQPVAPPPSINQIRSPGSNIPPRANLQKQRDARGRYVDVLAGTLKPSPSAPASLFSVTPAPTAGVKPESFLMPLDARRISESQEENESEHSSQASSIEQQQLSSNSHFDQQLHQAPAATYGEPASTIGHQSMSLLVTSGQYQAPSQPVQPAVNQASGNISKQGTSVVPPPIQPMNSSAQPGTVVAPPPNTIGGSTNLPHMTSSGAAKLGGPPPPLSQATTKNAVKPEAAASSYQAVVSGSSKPAAQAVPLAPPPVQYKTSDASQPLDMDSVDSQLSRASSVNSISSEIQAIMQQPTTSVADQPVFFNPMQLSQPMSATSGRSAGYHYGQRRAYPR